MTNAYSICQKDKTILLVGEGNFSFSKDFIIFNEKNIDSLGQIGLEIISTCKESSLDITPCIKSDCVRVLKSKGKLTGP